MDIWIFHFTPELMFQGHWDSPCDIDPELDVSHELMLKRQSYYIEKSSFWFGWSDVSVDLILKGHSFDIEMLKCFFAVLVRNLDCGRDYVIVR